MRKIQRKIFNLGMVVIVLFLSMNLYPNSSKPVFEEKKYVALTYDDGPSTLTTKPLLELLEKYDSSATFFINGNHANNHKELVKEIYESGNEVYEISILPYSCGISNEVDNRIFVPLRNWKKD